MKRILISIHPQYVENIVKGTKKYEYRTRAAKEDVCSILIYTTYPVMKVVAEVEIIEVLEMSPEELWKRTKNYSGTTKSYFDEYFLNRDIAYAYKLGEVKVFDEAKDLSDFGIKYAPQSFVYIQ